MLRTSSRLAPSLTTNRPCDLPVKKTRDASNRRLPPNRTACTRTSSVPGSSRHFRSGDAPRSLRLRAVNRGTGRFTTSETASAGRHSNAVSSCSLPHGWSHERGRLLPTALDATEPLTPLSRSTVHPHASLTFARAATWPYVLLREELVRIGGCGRPPRPPSSPPREKRRFVMIRDAFRQQGLFVGSGGRYSPGPATASPPCGDGSTAG